MMSVFYLYQGLMLLVALGLIAAACGKNRALWWLGLLSVATLVFTLVIYQQFGAKQGMRAWFESGEQHYQLSQEVNQLGGIEGIIARVKQKLELNPNDAAGWFILGKIYLGNHQYAEAVLALGKAMQLKPADKAMAEYYQLARRRLAVSG
jgi:cytochrome c-type biogenesis protein CcmH/NrfG